MTTALLTSASTIISRALPYIPSLTAGFLIGSGTGKEMVKETTETFSLGFDKILLYAIIIVLIYHFFLKN